MPPGNAGSRASRSTGFGTARAPSSPGGPKPSSFGTYALAPTFQIGLGEPRVEVGCSDAGAVARRQLAGLELGAEVVGVRVGDDRPLVPGGGEQAPRPGVDAQRLGPAEFDAAIDRRSGRQLGDGRGDVVGG